MTEGLMNPFETLGIASNATQKQIKAAYFKKSKALHPDKGGSNEAFHAVKDAYDALRDPVKAAEEERKAEEERNNNSSKPSSSSPSSSYSFVFQTKKDPENGTPQPPGQNRKKDEESWSPMKTKTTSTNHPSKADKKFHKVSTVGVKENHAPPPSPRSKGVNHHKYFFKKMVPSHVISSQPPPFKVVYIKITQADLQGGSAGQVPKVSKPVSSSRYHCAVEKKSSRDRTSTFGKRKDGKPCQLCIQINAFCHHHKDQDPLSRHYRGPGYRHVVYGITKEGKACKRCLKEKGFCFQHKHQEDGAAHSRRQAKVM